MATGNFDISRTRYVPPRNPVSHALKTCKGVAVAVTMVCQACKRQHFKEISELKASPCFGSVTAD